VCTIHLRIPTSFQRVLLANEQTVRSGVALSSSSGPAGVDPRGVSQVDFGLAA